MRVGLGTTACLVEDTSNHVEESATGTSTKGSLMVPLRVSNYTLIICTSLSRDVCLGLTIPTSRKMSRMI